MILDIDPKAKGLIFDLDGTISDTMPIHYIAWRNAAAKHGIDFTVELFGQLAGIPLYPTVEKLNELFGTSIDPQQMGDEKEMEYENNMHQAVPIRPVVEIIKKYHGKIPMAVGTGGLKRLAKKSLELIGIDKYIDIIVAYEDVKNYKPHPETFLRCAELMGVEPQFCQVFEDGVLGIEAAKKAGMMVVDVKDFYDVTIGH
ncbi:HAD family hydrolase [Gaoshiqia sediminis]|uniref:Beta-phosphoglucomutase family hydrolase n=1 Tax=Gaoshiqia sediminis TaxID=2986998 RepID=A0AA41YAV8_9BACT|nr:beta-phosphoglucomutase family hydrolase [Gaoshiqia sediminis]MCW0481242.1 beta-phosphoglucomutase family hydrolase [Gaoshiqia sediminis]